MRVPSIVPVNVNDDKNGGPRFEEPILDRLERHLDLEVIHDESGMFDSSKGDAL
jgi:hypothetical protein